MRVDLAVVVKTYLREEVPQQLCLSARSLTRPWLAQSCLPTLKKQPAHMEGGQIAGRARPVRLAGGQAS